MIKAKYKFDPDWLHLVPPGDSILEDMEGLGLSQIETAKRTGYSTKHIHQLIKGEAHITADTALRLEKVLSYSADFWLNMESTYREALAKEAEKIQLAQDKDWLKQIPLADMLKFDWVKKFADKGQQVAECLKFYGVSSVKVWQDQEQNYQVAFKAYEKFNMNDIAIQTWLRQGEIEANNIACQLFYKSKLKENLPKLRDLTTQTDPQDFVPILQKICAECGVAVVFVPTPKNCAMSGATKWIGKNKALVMLSLRYKTNDYLWFAFFHEIAHIIKHKKQIFLESNKKDFIGDKQLEDEADKFATELLIPPTQAHHLQNLQTKAEIKKFAKSIGIASGVVVGRLQHDGIIAYSYCNDLKVKYQFDNQ